MTDLEGKKSYRSFTLGNFRKIPQIQQYLTEEQQFEIEVVGNVLPFKANNYVIDELINWENAQNDPIYILTFPSRDLLKPEHYQNMAEALKSGKSKAEIRTIANEIRLQLNPHPAGQLEHNVPMLNDTKLMGIQHKYRETVLFFPQQGQTCHAYCTFCFRWPQFVGMDEFKFAMKEADILKQYVQEHPEATDILFTGGDPMIMKTRLFRQYVEPFLENDRDSHNIQTIRIGTKALGYWPYKFTTDPDAQDMLDLFKQLVDAGYNLSIMAHFNHWAELETDAVKEAVRNIKATGAQIRTQSPILSGINDEASVWSRMWRTQVNMGMIPYYMFLPRDTGAKHYFDVTLEEAWYLFREAYQNVSGVCRTVRGPSMSAGPGKVQILGTEEVLGQKVFVLRFLQGRDPDWVHRPFFAKYNAKASWLDDLEPAFGEEAFFFEQEPSHSLHK
ncbi:MAG TPA: lysine 2,3-aminomutase [Cytophagales bacterium]|nr:lysine 2,3-aminomutase [Cytophagales bacterium]HAA23216.1 lysine 2,3-aminomutase [Cytophagales bacterium]HAP58496.1 lysine 2,3-aminomutase [Cytophagales bacterium]